MAPAVGVGRKKHEIMSAPYFDQRLMYYAALKQATERAEKEGIPCFIYRGPDATWYVRTAEEGAPDGAEFIRSTVE
jgi:hypothetical protein